MIRLYITLLILLFASLADGASIKQRVYLDVPIVRQSGLLCGPATIEMLFRYWGIDQYSQYDIASSMLKQFPDSIRYQKSGIYNTFPVNWKRYPGTATANMYDFLKRFANTHQFLLEEEADLAAERIKNREQIFSLLKWYVSNGIPVIVHQNWKLQQAGGHYRIVTGYDAAAGMVYLNDPDGGRRIVQSYETFLRLWNVDQKWLHYNAIAFNVGRRRLKIEL